MLPSEKTGSADLMLDGVRKTFGATVAVDSISLDAPQGCFMALLGPSGCGKTTILRLVAGFETATAGRIVHGDQIWSDAGGAVHVVAERRRVGVVFQSYALWPHLTVADNVGYPLRVAKCSRPDRDAGVRRALETVGLTGFGERQPAELSGGQRQRVALARCLVMEPDIVVLDEPLANLDAHLRAAMMEVFGAFHRQTGATMIYVTHDQTEAMALADRIAVMFEGRLAQVDSPERIYGRPANETVARFIGEGAVLKVPVLRRDGDQVVADLFGQEIPVHPSFAGPDGVETVCVRPDRCRIDPAGVIEARILHSIYRGSHWLVDAEPCTGDGTILHIQCRARPPGDGDTVRVAVEAVTPVGVG